MSDLRSRLLRHKSSMGLSEAGAPQSNEAALQLEPSTAAGEAHEAAMWRKLGCTIVSNTLGSYVSRVVHYPLEHEHGHYKLEQFREHAELLSVLCAGQQVRPHRLLFLDTETTGLGVGAGNMPFMIGIGRMESDHYIVEQLLCRNPADEAAALHRLSELIHSSDGWITYNGKSFDWPVVQNRYVLHRLPADFGPKLHLDLLYTARSLWRSVLESCRLSMVEQKRLGLARHEDVPGALAPTLYYQYLQSGDADVLDGVLRHNEHDILSLVTLAAHTGQLLAGRHERIGPHPRERLKLALWLERLKRTELALDTAELLPLDALAPVPDVAAELGQFYKRQKRLDLAVPVWRFSAEQPDSFGGAVRQSALIELSMYYEHHERDYKLALSCAESALQSAQRRMSVTRRRTDPMEAVHAIQKRIDRLRKKLGVAPAAPVTAHQIDLFA